MGHVNNVPSQEGLVARAGTLYFLAERNRVLLAESLSTHYTVSVAFSSQRACSLAEAPGSGSILYANPISSQQPAPKARHFRRLLPPPPPPSPSVARQAAPARVKTPSFY